MNVLQFLRLDDLVELALLFLDGSPDAVKAMPDKSKMLSGDDKKKLEKGVKTVSDLATALDDAGDNNNQKATEEGQKKLDTVLKAIEELYPKDALKAPEGKK